MKRKIVNAVKLGFVLLLVYLGTRQVYRYIALQNSDVIVRIAYRGLENLFHAPYEYYAVSLRSSCKIPKSMIKKRFGEEVEKLEIYDDIDTKYWLVMLTYSENGFDYLEGNPPCLLTAFGDEYRVSYSSRSGDGKEPSIDDLNVMVKAVEKLYERDPTKRMSWQGTPYDVLYFILIQHGEEYLIANNVADSLHRIQKNGDIVKVMDLPKKGEFDYYYFYGSNEM